MSQIYYVMWIRGFLERDVWGSGKSLPDLFFTQGSIIIYESCRIVLMSVLTVPTSGGQQQKSLGCMLPFVRICEYKFSDTW